MMTGPPHIDAAKRDYADDARAGSCASSPKNKNKQAPGTPHTHGAVELTRERMPAAGQTAVKWDLGAVNVCERRLEARRLRNANG